MTKARISLIAAIDHNRVIGINNELPWHMPADLKFFRDTTRHKPVVMGRKTLESIGRALPNRRNLVVTKDPNFTATDCEVYHSLNKAIEAATNEPEVMILGGAQIFEQALPIAHRMYLTIIHHEFKGDTRFPQWDPKLWQEVERHDCSADNDNPYPYSFITLDKVTD